MNTYDFSNNNISWDANIIGLVPVLNDKALAFLNNYSNNSRSLMLDYLTKDDKFVFAHVILCMHFNQMIHSDGKWNGLTVKLNADKSVQYDLNERKYIEKKWKEFLSNNTSK